MHSLATPDDLIELRLMVEELVCHIFRFDLESVQQVAPEDVSIRQEVPLGGDKAFADILVRAPGVVGSMAEVDLGYSPERVIESLRRKLAHSCDLFSEIKRLVLVYEPDPRTWGEVRKTILDLLPNHWNFEVWDTAELLGRVRETFGVDMQEITAARMPQIRAAIDRAKGEYAFGEAAANEPIEAALLWQFSHWRLRQLFARTADKRAIVEPANYSAAVVVFADLCGFSGYVRDTPSGNAIRTSLSSFYSKARYQIINDGGMLYQVLGDAVIGVFGVPDQPANYAGRSFECARALLDIANSVSNEWQRRIDRLQPVRGGHIGMAIGELQFVSLRPFSRTHLGIIGDAINLAARLSNAAQPGEIVISNSLQLQLPYAAQQRLREIDPIEAKNVGRIKAWRYHHSEPSPSR